MIVLKEACLWGWGTKDENINLKWLTSICLQELFVQVHTGAATTTPLRRKLRPRNCREEKNQDVEKSMNNCGNSQRPCLVKLSSASRGVQR